LGRYTVEGDSEPQTFIARLGDLHRGGGSPTTTAGTAGARLHAGDAATASTTWRPIWTRCCTPRWRRGSGPSSWVIRWAASRSVRGRSATRIAADTPHLTTFVELTGGHCAILERPEQVNRQLRALAESVIPRERAGYR